MQNISQYTVKTVKLTVIFYYLQYPDHTIEHITGYNNNLQNLKERG